MAETVVIFEVADHPAAKGRIVACFSSVASAQRGATRFYEEIMGRSIELSWAGWFGDGRVAEVPRFLLGGVARPCVFRLSIYPLDQALSAADAAALSMPSKVTT